MACAWLRNSSINAGAPFGNSTWQEMARSWDRRLAHAIVASSIALLSTAKAGKDGTDIVVADRAATQKDLGFISPPTFNYIDRRARRDAACPAVWQGNVLPKAAGREYDLGHTGSSAMVAPLPADQPAEACAWASTEQSAVMLTRRRTVALGV